MKYRSVEMRLIKTKAALQRGIDLSQSGFYSILNAAAIKGDFLFKQSSRRQEAKTVFTRDKTCLKTLSERDFGGFSVLNIIQWWKNNKKKIPYFSREKPPTTNGIKTILKYHKLPRSF